MPVRYLVIGWLIIVFASYTLGYNAQACADTPVNTVTLTATIRPAKYLIVDNNREIKEILSNTKENVVPTVYINSISPGNMIPLSNNIYDQYISIAACSSINNIGAVYK